MPISEEGIRLLKDLEGSRAQAYKDSAGLLTIGIGHLLTKDELSSGEILLGDTTVQWRQGLTDTQIESLLRQDLAALAVPLQHIETALPITLSQSQRDALAIFIYNIGPTAFLKSTLCKCLEAGDLETIPEQWRRWNRCGTKVIKGLKIRRERELALWHSKDEALID
jgi:lysozyme